MAVIRSSPAGVVMRSGVSLLMAVDYTPPARRAQFFALGRVPGGASGKRSAGSGGRHMPLAWSQAVLARTPSGPGLPPPGPGGGLGIRGPSNAVGLAAGYLL